MFNIFKNGIFILSKVNKIGSNTNSRLSLTMVNNLNTKYKTSFPSLPQRFLFSIFVKPQATPNPHFLKFFPGKEILNEGETYDFSNVRQAISSPLAVKLFEINGITRVFYGKDYISVGKKEMSDWGELKPLVIDVICDYFTKNLELFDTKPEAEDTKINENDSETVSMIKEIISARIRPVVQEDGGDIKFISYDEPSGTVYLQMKGSCSGCPSSSVTLKGGIEKMLVHYVSGVKNVEAVDDD
jgi:Fe-S cluster biogenesis protein NfuA